jgi:hypothetical protein
MVEAFANLLKDVETDYYFNNQQGVNIKVHLAPGSCYRIMTIFSKENEKNKTTIEAFYQDEYVRENDYWLIAKKVETFEW